MEITESGPMDGVFLSDLSDLSDLACGADAVANDSDTTSVNLTDMSSSGSILLTEPDRTGSFDQPDEPCPDTPIPYADWGQELRLKVLLSRPELREAISRAGRAAELPLSGEDFLKLCDKAFKPMTGVSLNKVVGFVYPIYCALGVRSGQQQSWTFTQPPGQVLVSLLCSLVRHGQGLRHYRQEAEACILDACLPSSIWAFEGSLIVVVQRAESGTRVDAATSFPGQLMDWGKSRRCLKTLQKDLNRPPILA